MPLQRWIIFFLLPATLTQMIVPCVAPFIVLFFVHLLLNPRLTTLFINMVVGQAFGVRRILHYSSIHILPRWGKRIIFSSQKSGKSGKSGF
jgi:hypothetical protein